MQQTAHLLLESERMLLEHEPTLEVTEQRLVATEVHPIPHEFGGGLGITHC